MAMKRSRIITMNKKRYVVVNHLDGKYNHVSLVLTPNEYSSGLERGLKWRMHKKKLQQVI